MPTGKAVPVTPEETACLAASAQRAAHDAATAILRVTPDSPKVRSLRALELAVHTQVAAAVRQAREAGEPWAAIGELLGLGPIAGDDRRTLAVLGFDYAAGPRFIDPAFPVPVSFAWTCPGCAADIADYGPDRGPHLDEDGHVTGCPRLAADAADWDQEVPSEREDDRG